MDPHTRRLLYQCVCGFIALADDLFEEFPHKFIVPRKLCSQSPLEARFLQVILEGFSNDATICASKKPIPAGKQQ